MEHEIEKRIREKVKEAEGQPSNWQKERVWQMIRPESTPKSPPAIYYYAAASIVVVLVVIFYLVHLEDQNQLESKIASLESAINNKIKLKKQDRSLSEVPRTVSNPVCFDKNAPTNTAIRKIRSVQDHQVVNSVPEIAPGTKVEQSEIAELTFNDGPVSELSVEIMPETPPVLAIIGFIPKQQTEAVKSRVKRPGFRLFRNRNEEYNTFPQEENRLLTARIN